MQVVATTTGLPLTVPAGARPGSASAVPVPAATSAEPDTGDTAPAERQPVDMAALQLELMLGLLKVYTPPPPPSPQELGQQLAEQRAARYAAEAEARASGSTDAGAVPSTGADDATALVPLPGRSAAGHAGEAADAAVDRPRPGDDDAAPTTTATAEPPEARLARRFQATALGPQLDTRA